MPLPFLGPSERPTPLTAPKPTFNHPVARGTTLNENLNKPYQDNEPATPQPVANATSHPVKNVAPPGMEKVVKALKKQPGVDNPFAVAWSLKK